MCLKKLFNPLLVWFPYKDRMFINQHGKCEEMFVMIITKCDDPPVVNSTLTFCMLICLRCGVISLLSYADMTCLCGWMKISIKYLF